jgi:hypothetical protein
VEIKIPSRATTQFPVVAQRYTDERDETVRALLRWTAASVALVAGLVLGTGTANASTSAHSAQHATVHSAATGGMHPNDWWW